MITILCADARHLTKVVNPYQRADLTITSPPYNVGKKYGKYDDYHDDEAYYAMLQEVWAQVWQVSRPGARLAVVVPRGVGRNPWITRAARVADTMVRAGWELRGSIIWDKFTTGNRTSWGSWRSPSNPCLRDRTEEILVAHKQTPKLEIPSVYDKDLWITSEQFTEYTQDLWKISPESAKRVGHPAPFPQELVYRLIKLYAFRGATILDPFAGSGTVGVVAHTLGCPAILVDLDPHYCNLMAARLNLTGLSVQVVKTP